MSWDVAALRKMVRARFGAEQEALLAPCTKSIQDRFRFARYHFNEAKKLLENHLGDDHSTAFTLEFGPTSDEQESYLQAKCHARAHVTACLQNIHALSDTMGHVLCFALGLNRGSEGLREREISMRSILQRLSQMPDGCTLVNLLNVLMHSGDYQYLSAVVNHSKHRSLVDPVVTHFVEPTGNGPWDLQLSAFCRDKKRYSVRSLASFLRPEYERQSRLIVQIGCALNDVVATAPTARHDIISL